MVAMRAVQTVENSVAASAGLRADYLGGCLVEYSAVNWAVQLAAPLAA